MNVKLREDIREDIINVLNKMSKTFIERPNNILSIPNFSSAKYHKVIMRAICEHRAKIDKLEPYQMYYANDEDWGDILEMYSYVTKEGLIPLPKK